MKTTQSFSGIKYLSDIKNNVVDELTVEEILNIYINNEPYTMTMRTPGDEEALTRGILLSEQVYTNPNQNPIFSILEKNNNGYITKVNVIIQPDELKDGIHNKRNLISVSSCGMCGKNEMDLALQGERIKAKEKLQLHTIPKMFEMMTSKQNTFQSSGGSHAATIFDNKMNLLSIHEDIGRHNAVDKTIGDLLLKNKINDAFCLLVSGRVSYEIVSKCFYAKIPFLAAVSAPSSMAVEYCEQVGITLIAFCREDRYTVYTNTHQTV